MVDVEFNYFEKDLVARTSQIVYCAMNASKTEIKLLVSLFSGSVDAQFARETFDGHLISGGWARKKFVCGCLRYTNQFQYLGYKHGRPCSGVQNKSKAPRERKDFLVNVFRANLNCFQPFLFSLARYFSPSAPPSCHTMPFISAKSANRWTFDVPFRPESIACLHRLSDYFQLVASFQVIAMRCSVRRTAINLKLISESRTCITASLPPRAVLCRDDDTNRRNQTPTLCYFPQLLARALEAKY